MATPALKNIPEGHVLKVVFTQMRNLSGLPKPILSKGDLTLWNGKGFIWRTNEPFLTTTLITKKGIFQIEEGKKIPAAQMGNEKSIFEMLSKLLQGSLNEVKGFSLASLPSTPGKWKIRLSPIQSTIKDFLINLEIEGNDYITQITIHRANGDTDEISLSHHKIYDAKAVNNILSIDEKRLFND